MKLKKKPINIFIVWKFVFFFFFRRSEIDGFFKKSSLKKKKIFMLQSNKRNNDFFKKKNKTKECSYYFFFLYISQLSNLIFFFSDSLKSSNFVFSNQWLNPFEFWTMNPPLNLWKVSYFLPSFPFQPNFSKVCKATS